VTGYRRLVLTLAAGVALVGGVGGFLVTRPKHTPVALPTRSPSRSATPSRTLPTPVPTRSPAELAGAAAPGPAPNAAVVGAALARAFGDKALGARVDALVVDAATGTTLYDRGSGVAVVPASTAKVFTAAAALRALGPTRRLTTRIVASGAVTNGVLRGDLVVVGGGDPTLTAETAPTAYPRPARLADLAAQVRATGITKVTGGIVVDGSLFAGARLGPFWKPTYVTEGSVAPVGAFEVDGGRLRPGDDDRSQRPEVTAGLELRAALARAGVTVAGKTVRNGTAPATATEVALVRSPPVPALVERLLQRSDNDLAESLARHVALARNQPATFAGGAAAVAATVRDLGADPPALFDASGLSPRDRVTPAQLVALLTLATRDGALAPVLSGLPVAAFSGTLSGRYDRGRATVAAGFVRAKTGSLDNVATLAGVVETRSGRVIVFAFAADRLPTKFVGAAARALDAAAATLAVCGCT
jgi:D-alanyl-D-alanine carboxypeptidase/D-alanyl-D-alanine-endopeptidase (penicillin-binding protein 4)